jgi:hypothetical protein
MLTEDQHYTLSLPLSAYMKKHSLSSFFQCLFSNEKETDDIFRFFLIITKTSLKIVITTVYVLNNRNNLRHSLGLVTLP